MDHLESRPPDLPPTVLVVEDECAIRGLLALALSRAGFVVVLTGRGEEAVVVFRRGGIDAVLLDVQMTGLDGVQTARALRAIDPAARCFFMTGNPGRYTPADLAAAGAVRVFRKPLNVAEVVEALRAVTRPGRASVGLVPAEGCDRHPERHPG